jgi:hypothetical protein
MLLDVGALGRFADDERVRADRGEQLGRHQPAAAAATGTGSACPGRAA